MKREAFPAVLVDEAKDAQPPAIVGAVGYEVPAPDVIEPLGPRGDPARGTSPSAWPRPPALDPQPALAPDALHQLAPHLPTLRTHQAGELAIAQPRVFAREGLHFLVQLQQPARRRFSLVATARSMQSQVPARPPLRAQPGFHHALNGSLLVLRAYHFFAFTSSNTRILSRLSASIFLSSLFSFSSSRYRRASCNSIPPYFFFQR